MSIVKITSIALLLVTQSGLAETVSDCGSILRGSERTLKYFACLQEDLAEAEIKAKIKEAENRGASEDKMLSSPMLGFAGMPEQFSEMGEIADMTRNDKSSLIELPRYIAYSASRQSKEAVIAYGKSEIRVNKGSVLSGGWVIQDFNEYSLTVMRNKEKRMIPLTIVSGDDLAW
jgi:hypothetical protein